MFTKLKLTVLAVVVGTAGLASAAPARRDEHRAKRLEAFDTNKNGALDPAEKETMHEARAQKMFAKLDVNKDGKLSFDEFKAAKHGKFGKRHGRRAKGL